MKFLCVLCVLCGLFVPAFSLDRNAFTFTNYDLRVRVEPEQQRLAVRGRITLRNDSGAPQKAICLQISSSLDWRSITVDGKPVEFVSQPYLSDIDHTGALSEAIVSLAQAVPPQASIELEIGYEGVILPDATRLTRIGVPEITAQKTDWDAIGSSFSAVRGIGYVTWYPVATEAATLSQENSVPETIVQWERREASARMNVQFCRWRSPGDSLVALMNSPSPEGSVERLTGESSDAMTCNKHVFATLGQTAPLFVLGRYKTVASPEANIFYLPGQQTEAGIYARAGEQVLPFITSWFGVLHQKAAIVDLPDSAAAPYESGAMLLTPMAGVKAEQAQITAVYQLAHAAFPSPRLWIYEGLAHLAQALYRERQGDRETAINFMSSHLPAIVAAESELAAERDKDSSRESLLHTSVEELYRSKAMYVWWMLRDMLGDSVLKRALAAYHPAQDQAPSYLQHLLEAQSKYDLKWFFDDWVYHDRGLPDFRIVSVYPSKINKGSYLVAVTVENLGEAGAEVPVTLQSPIYAEVKRLEVRGKSRNTIRFVVSSLPSQAIVNDGSVPESDVSNNTFEVQSSK